MAKLLQLFPTLCNASRRRVVPIALARKNEKIQLASIRLWERLVFRRDHMHRKVTYSAAVHQGRQELRYLRKIVKKIIRAANLREELSFTSFLQAASPRGPTAI
jgi:phage terminase large subunit-like protein